MKKKKINWKLIFSILFPVAVGALSALLSQKGMRLYGTLPKPPLSPPAFLFPIAWTILYIMMGFAYYLILTSGKPKEKQSKATFPYWIQLAMNFFWSLFFFNLNLHIFAFIWLIVMLAAILWCTYQFFLIRKTAGWMMIPYNLWMLFAAYLNGAILFM